MQDCVSSSWPTACTGYCVQTTASLTASILSTTPSAAWATTLPRKLRRRRKYKRYEQPWPEANIQIDVKHLPQIRQRA